MSNDHWVLVTLPYMQFLYVTAGGTVTEAALAGSTDGTPPELEWIIGRLEKDVAGFYRRRKAAITVLEPS